MRRSRRAAVLATAALLVTPVVAQAATPSALAPPDAGASLQPWLAGHLGEVAPDATLRVMVRGTSEAVAAEAVQAAGMRVQQQWPLLDIAVAVGPAGAVPALLDQEGVVHVEGDAPLAYHLQTAHEATRSDEAAASFPTADGTGVSIAVIDSGIDGTHPFFQRDGESTVVQNRKNVCGIDFQIDPALSETCFAQVPTNDTDTISGGGHGTHVAGIAAGVPVTTTSPSGTSLRGSAPGAHLVGLSVGAAIGLLDAVAAQNWVLEHQQNPCRTAAEQTDAEVDPLCPPIRVTNHSYGPIATEGEDQVFDEQSAAVVAQRVFIEMGGVAVWAAGNDGGDGSFAATNPAGMDPTPGVLMVASYDDGQTGDPDNKLSSFSSRGKIGALDTYPDLAAPGDRITSSCRPTLAICQGSPSFDTGNYQTISGTSMAAPYVAGVVAQLFSADPALDPAGAEDVLEDTAHAFTTDGELETDPTNPGTPTTFDRGHGLVDVLAALGAVRGAPVAEPAPASALAPRCGDGTDLVVDPAGDTNAPGGTGAPAPAQDLLSLSFAADGDVLTVTSRYVDLSQLPAPGSTSTTHTAVWLGPDGVQYGVSHVSPGGGYTVGRFDPAANRLAAGTTTDVTGSFTSGPDGTVSWQVPLALVGSPAIPVDQTTVPDAAPAVRDSFALAVAGVGALGTGLVFVAPVDRAPDGGATPAWSVCNSEPVEDDPVIEDPGTEEPPAECTRPNGKPCKGSGGGKPDKP